MSNEAEKKVEVHADASHVEVHAEASEDKAAAPEFTFDDFLKVVMTVGQIKKCEPMEGSSKLYRLSVDFGELGTRQVLSGIAKHYACEELTGRKGLFVTNLPPRKMMGTVSEGMILGAEDKDGAYRIAAANPRIPNGTRLG